MIKTFTFSDFECHDMAVMLRAAADTYDRDAIRIVPLGFPEQATEFRSLAVRARAYAATLEAS